MVLVVRKAHPFSGPDVGGIGHGDGEEELRASAKLAFRPDPATVRADDPLRDGEA